MQLNKIEQTVFNILKSMKVNATPQVTIDKYTVDFLIGDKYIIECYGDFWHCNPQKYSPSYFNKGKRKTAKEIWERDLHRKSLFESMGYTFIFLWESEIKKNPKKIKAKLKKLIKEGKHGYRN